MVARGELGRSQQALSEQPEIMAREFQAAKGAPVAPSCRLREDGPAGMVTVQSFPPPAPEQLEPAGEYSGNS